MRKLIAFTLSISVFSVALPARADKLLSRCSELAINLNLSLNICDGKIEGLNKQIQNLSIKHNTDLVNLGIYLRQLGYLGSAKYLINAALEHVSVTDERYSDIKLSLANITYREYKDSVAGDNNIYDLELMRRMNTDGYDKALKAFSEYDTIISSHSSASIKAELNWLRLWVSLKQNSPILQDLRRSKSPTFSIIVTNLINQFSNKFEKETEYELNFSEILIQSDVADYRALGAKYLEKVLHNVNSSIQPKTFSRLLGALGKYYQKTAPVDAIDCFIKARNAALEAEDLNLAFQWNAELGKLYRSQGDYVKAEEVYQEALVQINTIQVGSLPFLQDVQYQTYVATNLVYQEYLDLLFSNEKPEFSEILRVYELEKRSQIEYFLQCSLHNTVGLSQLPLKQLSDVTIYIIRLPAQYKIVAKFKDGTIKYHTLNSKQFDLLLTEVRKITNAQNLKLVSKDSLHNIFGKLYESILAPFEGSLPPKNGSITFVTNPYLQNIPLNALYTSSGEYLLQKFVVTYSSGLKVKSKDIATNNRRIIAAGISTQTQGFSSLPAVQTELKSIAHSFPKTKVMLNSSFRKKDFLKEAAKATIIHVASHANFSANPLETFIVSWNEKIGLDDLQNLVDLREFLASSPYELLFFSVCEGAKGNQTSDLGITGTSLRAGARSAIATLWRIEDESMANLVANFYLGLSNHLTIPEALRSAQIESMKSQNPKFRRFSNWAGIGLYEN